LAVWAETGLANKRKRMEKNNLKYLIINLILSKNAIFLYII
jgi:hypothetical protein